MLARTAAPLHQPERSRVFLTQKQIQVRISSRLPVSPPALPVRTPEIAHAFAQYLNRAGRLVSGACIKDKIRTASQVHCPGIFRRLDHGLDSFLHSRSKREQQSQSHTTKHRSHCHRSRHCRVGARECVVQEGNARRDKNQGQNRRNFSNQPHSQGCTPGTTAFVLPLLR
jgi:hypothetical protein